MCRVLLGMLGGEEPLLVGGWREAELAQAQALRESLEDVLDEQTQRETLSSPGHDLFYTSGSVSRLDSDPLPRSTNLDFSLLSDLAPSKCPVILVSRSQQGSHDQVCPECGGGSRCRGRPADANRQTAGAAADRQQTYVLMFNMT